MLLLCKGFGKGFSNHISSIPDSKKSINFDGEIRPQWISKVYSYLLQACTGFTSQHRIHADDFPPIVGAIIARLEGNF